MRESELGSYRSGPEARSPILLLDAAITAMARVVHHEGHTTAVAPLPSRSQRHGPASVSRWPTGRDAAAAAGRNIAAKPVSPLTPPPLRNTGQQHALANGPGPAHLAPVLSAADSVQRGQKPGRARPVHFVLSLISATLLLAQLWSTAKLG